MRPLHLIAMLALCLSLAACAERITPAELKAEGTHPAWLAGDWQGTAYQVPSSKDPGGNDEAGQLDVVCPGEDSHTRQGAR